MKRLRLVAALGLAAIVVLVVLAPTRRAGPEPIVYGRDACARCRMHLSEPGFAGELRDAAGALAKFDDLGCLVLALADGRKDTPGAWAEDHGTRELVPLLAATLVRGKKVTTPMGHGIVAFADARAAHAFAERNSAEVVGLERLLRELPGAASGRGGD